MVAVRGIFNGQNIQLLEKVELKPNTLVLVTFLETDPGDSDLRSMTSDPSGFAFWENPAEDLYQDLADKMPHENR